MPKKGRSNGLAGLAMLTGWLLASGLPAPVAAIQIDSKGEIQLGLRTYTAARIGTEDTDAEIFSDGNRQVYRSLTFPITSAGTLRQHRGFAEVELRHELTRLLREDFGPFVLLNYLPFKIRNLRYFISYRGEFEGIYDYGPSEFRTHEQWSNQVITVDPPDFGVPTRSRDEITRFDRTRLRDIGTVRNRLFQAYVQAQAGHVTVRFGRQILAWGETDVFRLLDNINPLDASFGGFLVSLDERRVPLDMLRTTWYFGDFSNTGIPGLSLLSNLPWYEAYLEGFVAIDEQVGFFPGVPKGSAWGPPNVNVPSLSILTDFQTPNRQIEDARGGFQFRFSTPFPGVGDVALGLAHYFTYSDLPAVRTVTGPQFPIPIQEPGKGQGYSVWAQQTSPRMRVSGVFGNFAIPPEWVAPLGISSEPIIRFETAYIKNEPRNEQAQLDPFLFNFLDRGLDNCTDEGLANDVDLAFRVDENGKADPNGRYCTAGNRVGDSWNVVLGMDLNQWVRWINPDSSLFITTQFFYRHLRGAQKREPVVLAGGREPSYLPGQKTIHRGEVLPVQNQVISADAYAGAALAGTTDATVPNFVHSPVDQFLHTLLIMSPYYSGRVLPSLTLVYDWQGAWVVQPSFTYSVDPFRFTVTYNFLAATDLKGGAGISLLRDRDNILFQLEYVI
jgi:hypothetical protein